MRRARIGNPPASSGQRDPTIQWLINAVSELTRASFQDTAEESVAAFQPKDATLTTIAALVGAADKGIVFTGPDVAALFDLKIGTWTPTLFNTTNVAASTAFLSHYIRIANQAICWGRVDIDPTAAAGAATVLGMSVPIASNFATTEHAGGVTATSAAQRSGAVIADAANDRVTFNFASEQLANIAWGFIFGYEII